MYTFFDSNDLLSFAQFCISKKRTSDLTKKYGVEKAFERRLQITEDDINAWLVAMSEVQANLEELETDEQLTTEEISE